MSNVSLENQPYSFTSPEYGKHVFNYGPGDIVYSSHQDKWCLVVKIGEMTENGNVIARYPACKFLHRSGLVDVMSPSLHKEGDGSIYFLPQMKLPQKPNAERFRLMGYKVNSNSPEVADSPSSESLPSMG